MILEAGQTAPDFDVTDMQGQPVRLADYRGRPLLLAFHRFAACPLCNLRTDQLLQYASIWQARGLAMLVFYQSTPETLEKYMQRRKPPFTVIADPDKAIYDLYGVRSSLLRAMAAAGPWHPKALAAMSRGYLPHMGGTGEDNALLPADFLVNPDGTIHTAHYGKTSADHLPVRGVVAFIEQQRQTAAVS